MSISPASLNLAETVTWQIGFENSERSQLNEAGETWPFCRLNVGYSLRYKLEHRAFFRVESLASRWHDPEQGLTGR